MSAASRLRFASWLPSFALTRFPFALSLSKRRHQSGDAAGTHFPVRDFVDITSSQPARLLGFDQALVWVVVGLLALGLVMVYSASVALPDNPKFARYTPTFFLTRHIVSIAIASVKLRPMLRLRGSGSRLSARPSAAMITHASGIAYLRSRSTK